jgi:hypothetical protein
MKTLYATLLAAIFAAAAPAWAQTRIEQAPSPSGKHLPSPDAGKIPDPGLGNLPDQPGMSSGSSGDSPASSGIVKVPPSTGTENVVKPPKNIDPGITEPTDDIDRKNKQRSEEKTEAK